MCTACMRRYVGERYLLRVPQSELFDEAALEVQVGACTAYTSNMCM